MQNEHQIISKILQLIDNSKAMQVKKQCVELLPQLIKYLPEFQNNDSRFEQAMKSIFKFIQKKDKKASESEISDYKGVGFISLGKISILVSTQQLKPYLDQIFELIDAEISKKPTNIQRDVYVKPLQNTNVLYCIRDLARKYGEQLEKRYSMGPSGVASNAINMNQRLSGGGSIQLYEFIANLFYFGFKKQLINALKELKDMCNGQYKMGIQTKLLNTINIILTHKTNQFPVVQLINHYRKN
jgi:hypothetical protein